VVILKPFNVFQLPGVFITILRRKAHTSRSIETYTTDSLKITRTEDDSLHFDGEPQWAGKELSYAIEKSALNAIVGSKFAEKHSYKALSERVFE
jgi:diacylglycerol kinase family enzyme